MREQAPLYAHLITFGTYGTRLHGDDRGSFRKNAGFVEPNAPLMRHQQALLKAPPFILEEPARAVVLRAIQGVCAHRAWLLRAVHVRTEHVHIVVACDVTPERAMNDFKVWSTRALREVGMVSRTAPVWARHGSTVPLRDDDAVNAAAAYVYERQGEPMARFGC
jgi:hypothetical protein